MLVAGALIPRRSQPSAENWPVGVRLGPFGRVTESRIRLYSRPRPDGTIVVLEGYAYSSWVQPVRNAPNTAISAVPPDSLYVEVSVPFTGTHAQPDPESPVFYRLYYSTTYHASGLAIASDGSVWYQLNDENVEVFRAKIASGRDYFGPDGTTLGSLTPAGEHPLWSKRASRHMTGGTPQNGYDLPGVPWVMYFSGNGQPCTALTGTMTSGRRNPPAASTCGHPMPSDCSAGPCRKCPTCQALSRWNGRAARRYSFKADS